MNRRTIGLAVAVLVAVLAAWYLLLWSPTADDLDKAKARRQTAESQQQELQAEIARLRAAQRDEPKNRAKLERLRTAIPDDPALGEFILTLNDAATRSGIDFISIAPSQPKLPTRATTVTVPPASGATTTTAAATTATTAPPARAAAEIGLNIQIQGGYFQILDFLNRLDALPRLVVTDTLNVGGGNNNLLNVSISARMFVRQVPSGFAGAPAGTTTTTVAGGAGGSTTSTTGAGGAASSTSSTATTVAP